jgi:hypothetical protein
MATKPWYKVVTPREDLREGKPLDASEFAVHLDHMRDGRFPKVYQNPERFFERTFSHEELKQVWRPRCCAGFPGRRLGWQTQLFPR